MRRKSRLVGLVAGLGLFIGVAVSAQTPAEAANHQLCTAGAPCDARQIDITPTYADLEVRSCFRSDGYHDFESVTVQNQYANSTSRWFRVAHYRGDTFELLDGTVWVNIGRYDAFTFMLDGSDTGVSLDWAKRPNGYETYTKIIMRGGNGGIEVDWNVSPFNQGGNYQDTSDTIYPPGTQWNC